MNTRTSLTSSFAILAATALVAICTEHPAVAQVVVGDGQVLTADDLEAGEFDGVTFTLDESLTIDIESGGSLARLYSPTSFFFGLGGATINAGSGSVIQSAQPFAESSLLAHVTLNIDEGATVGAGLYVDGASGPTSIEVHGGQIGDGLSVMNAAITIQDGSIGDGLFMNGPFSFSFMDPPFSMSGGTIGAGMALYGRGLLAGGSIGDSLKVGFAGFGSLTVAGGSIGSGIFVGSYFPLGSNQVVGSELHLIVTELRIAGESVELEPGVPLTITQRGGALLEATLADGSPFTLVLNATFIPGADLDYVDAQAVLTATLAVVSGDLNDDGVVNGADLGILLNNWGGAGVGDLNGDGIVDGADLGILLNNWG